MLHPFVVHFEMEIWANVTSRIDPQNAMQFKSGILTRAMSSSPSGCFGVPDRRRASERVFIINIFCSIFRSHFGSSNSDGNSNSSFVLRSQHDFWRRAPFAWVFFPTLPLSLSFSVFVHFIFHIFNNKCDMILLLCCCTAVWRFMSCVFLRWHFRNYSKRRVKRSAICYAEWLHHFLQICCVVSSVWSFLWPIEHLLVCRFENRIFQFNSMAVRSWAICWSHDIIDVRDERWTIYASNSKCRGLRWMICGSFLLTWFWRAFMFIRLIRTVVLAIASFRHWNTAVHIAREFIAFAFCQRDEFRLESRLVSSFMRDLLCFVGKKNT